MKNLVLDEFEEAIWLPMAEALDVRQKAADMYGLLVELVEDARDGFALAAFVIDGGAAQELETVRQIAEG